MAYNAELAELVRQAIIRVKGVTEKKMFGGIAFMANDRMLIGVDKDDLIIRCEKEETDALLKLSFFSAILEVIPAALGTQSHRPGESWKPDLPMPRGKANGVAIFKDVEVGFGSIEERPDGPHARVFISGSFTVQRPLGYLATAQATFGIALTRRLSDLVDVETTIKGTFKDEYPVRLEKGGSGSIAHEFPYVVTRSIEIER